MPGYGCRCIDEVKCYIGNLGGTHEGLVIANSQKAGAQLAGTTMYDFSRYWNAQDKWPD